MFVYNESMNTKTLKWIALILMTIDHIGVHLVKNPSIYLTLKIIGRGAYPLYAFMLVNGFIHTKNMKKYFFRLFIFAALIELSYLILYLYNGTNYLLRNNIMLTLFASLLSLYLISHQKWHIKSLTILVLVISYLLKIDGSIYAILMVLFFYLSPSVWFNLLALAVLNFVFIWFEAMPAYQWASLYVIPLLFFYNGQYGKINRYFHYFYYPLHILVILLIKVLFKL